jgi:hypothetical protein
VSGPGRRFDAVSLKAVGVLAVLLAIPLVLWGLSGFGDGNPSEPDVTVPIGLLTKTCVASSGGSTFPPLRPPLSYAAVDRHQSNVLGFSPKDARAVERGKTTLGFVAKVGTGGDDSVRDALIERYSALVGRNRGLTDEPHSVSVADQSATIASTQHGSVLIGSRPCHVVVVLSGDELTARYIGEAVLGDGGATVAR